MKSATFGPLASRRNISVALLLIALITTVVLIRVDISSDDKKPVIKQGQSEARLFKIKSGEAFIVRDTDHGSVPLACLKEGEFFGNIPFLDMGHEPHSANVYASSDLKLATVDAQALQDEYDKISSTLKNICMHLATCISVTTIVAVDLQKKIN